MKHSMSQRSRRPLSKPTHPGFSTPRGSEAEDIVRAIGRGEVDAIVVVEGDEERIVSLADFGTVGELNEVVRAIRFGEVDALLVNEAGQDRVYTLAAIEKAMRESEHRFRELAESMPCIVFTAGTDGHIDYFNASWWSQTGLDRADPASFDVSHVLSDGDRQTFAAMWRQCLSSGECFEREMHFRFGSSQPRWYLVRAVPVHEVDGRVRRWFGICTDIERVKHAEEELDRQRKALEEVANTRSRELEASHARLRLSERMAVLGTLSAGIGHDLANLLFPIMTHLHSLQKQELPDRAAADISALRLATEHLRKLVGGLRAFAMDPFHESRGLATDLSKWWDEARALLSIVVPRNVVLRGDIPGNLPAVAMSPAALTQSVFNLVHNSVQVLNGRDDGMVEVWATVDGRDSRFLHIGVTDNGPGMDQETRDRCLEPFFTTRSSSNSTGLGLALVNQIIQQAGGHIEIESSEGAGTTFTLAVPIADGALS